jgi:hypothetical protein
VAYFLTGMSAVPAGVLYAQTGPQPSPVAGFSLVTQQVHYPTAALNAAVKTSSGEQNAATELSEQVTPGQQQEQQQQQQAIQQTDGSEIQAVQNIAFATGNAFPSGGYAGVIPAQAYGNAYLAQQPGVTGKKLTYLECNANVQMIRTVKYANFGGLSFKKIDYSLNLW